MKLPTRRSTSQIIQLKDTGANVFFNITTPKFAAQAIKKIGELGWKPAHYINNVSTSVGAVMKPAGFENSQGIITALYLKDPTDPQWAKLEGLPGLEGVHGQVHTQRRSAEWQPRLRLRGCQSRWSMVLKQCGDDLTRANVMKQAASLKGVEISRCCCPASRSTPARPTSIRSSRCGWHASRARPGSCSATSCPTKPQASRPTRVGGRRDHPAAVTAAIRAR